MSALPDDRLRARMQRAATKPAAATHTPAPRRRPTSPRPVRPAAAVERAQRVDPPAVQSRLATLAAWASWEVLEVPSRRLRWVAALLRGR